MTRPQDVRAAVNLGVDAIGVILHAASPRLIDVAVACEIRAQIPAFISLVGVFVDADTAFINRCISAVGLDLVQLHGNETDEFGRALDARFIKAIRARNAAQVMRDIEAYPNAAALLLDPYVSGQHGGTGTELDAALWPLPGTSPIDQSGIGPTQKLILAGGLSPLNIAAAVKQTQPYAIDLNSGVESQPGIKDPALIKAVMRMLGRG